MTYKEREIKGGERRRQMRKSMGRDQIEARQIASFPTVATTTTKKDLPVPEQHKNTKACSHFFVYRTFLPRMVHYDNGEIPLPLCMVYLPLLSQESDHTRNQSNPFDAVIHVQERKSASQEVHGIWDEAHPSRNSPNTSRRFALGVSNGSLIGQNPTTCSVPALQGCEGLWSYDYSHA